MSEEMRKFLEWNDLTQLHRQFRDAGDSFTEEEGPKMPVPDMPARPDLWTEAVHEAAEGRGQEAGKVYTKLLHSDMSEEGKIWWESMLAINMDAPPEELERIAGRNEGGRTENRSEYIRIAAGLFAKEAAEHKREIRRQKESEERERLRRLKEEADRHKQEKHTAEQNLKAHRQSQGDRR